MQRGRAGRGDGIVDAFDLEGGRQVRADGGRHAFRNGKRPDTLGRAGVPHNVMRGEQRRGRRPAGARHKAGARVADLVIAQARIRDGLLHCDIGISGTAAHEAQRTFVDVICDVDLECPGNPAAKAVLCHFGAGDDAAGPVFKRCQNFFCIVSDGRDNSQSCDNDAAHGLHSLDLCGAGALLMLRGPHACRGAARSFPVCRLWGDKSSHQSVWMISKMIGCPLSSRLARPSCL